MSSFKPSPFGSGPRTAPTEEECNVCESLGSKKPNPLLSVTIPTKPRSNPVSKPSVTQNETSEQAAVSVNSADGDSWASAAAPGITEIGNAGWTTLHTMAAYYPESATTEHQAVARQFLFSFSRLFPCKWCADDFAEYMEKHKPRVETRTEFSQWMCEAHNHVNQKLGKPLFDCSTVDQRWSKMTQKVHRLAAAAKSQSGASEAADQRKS